MQGSAAAILKIGWKSKPDPNMIISILKYFYKSSKLGKFEALSRPARGCRALEYFVEILYENTSCFYRINVDIIHIINTKEQRYVPLNQQQIQNY